MSGIKTRSVAYKTNALLTGEILINFNIVSSSHTHTQVHTYTYTQRHKTHKEDILVSLEEGYH